jgi:Pyruvate/2-oxoacid:ferredoxin oxidoreductase delta subunit
MLVDLNSFIKPRLYIMDGIMAMEGNGPMGGDPRKMNILLFSADPVALDATVCRIINVNPEFSLTVTMGKEAGQGTYLEQEIEILGDPIASFKNPEFNINREPLSKIRTGGRVARFINDLIIPKPIINENNCLKCGICVKMCPVDPKALDWHDGNHKNTPTYKYERCIRCYCCQEVCLEKAIQLKAPLLRRIFGKKKQKK